MAKIGKKPQGIILHDNQGNQTASYSAEMVETIKNTVAQDATDSELIMFLTVANKYNLDPFLNEIYFSKIGKNDKKAVLMTSRDGYRKIAMREPDYEVCHSEVVFPEDEFKMSREMGVVTNIIHNFTPSERKNRPLGAYAVLYTKSGHKIVSYVSFNEYTTGKNAWADYPSAMIKKVAENEVYKKFANINGINDFESMPEEFEKSVEAFDNTEVEYINVESKEIEGDD